MRPLVANGTVDSMLVSIDRAGRIVVPKEVRERFDLGPDAQLELEADHTGIHLRPLQPSRRA
ncbi:MAG: AbrB/MazE/SpoVT family DNA-binding domain-containing protein, partial [Acidimicrobiales bacterium]